MNFSLEILHLYLEFIKLTVEKVFFTGKYPDFPDIRESFQ